MKPKKTDYPDAEPCPYCGVETEFPCTNEEEAYDCYWSDHVDEEDLEDDY